MDIAVAGDATGQLVGTVSRGSGTEGVAGAAVWVSGSSPLGSWERQATTGEHGLFLAELPLCPQGLIEVSTRNEAETATVTVSASDVAQYLTPLPANGRLTLDGEWQFLPDAPADLPAAAASLDWASISVPSNYEMEGFRAEFDVAAYRKAVTIPASWAGKRIRLRAEAIYSHAEVWLNGVRVGSHDGGATPFELDLTDAARPGEPNELLIRVRARSEASKIDNMSVYAYFEVAGIWRPIEVFCVEPVHISRLTYSTVFDAAYQDAVLTVDLKIANEQSRPSTAGVNLQLIDPDGTSLIVDGLAGNVELGPWEEKAVTLKGHIPHPHQWNAELPRTYKLDAHLTTPGQPLARVEQTLGFRQVEIKGRCFTINGKPVRLFGACLHSTDPLMGRAITPDHVRRDLELMKGCNLNAIRTSHYPPHPAMPGIADEIGLYIEDEGPSCWAEGSEDLRNAPRYVGIVAEYMERDRNHPSVVYWSTCNESHYGIMFQLAHRYAKELDPTRPVGGTYATPEMDNDVYVIHHPGYTDQDIEKTKDLPKPVFYDECLTVPHGWGDYAYSLEIDPGMHDYWETGIYEIRRQVMAHENQVGTMIWAWADDAFCIPGRGIGYWRRDLPAIRYADSIYKMPGRGYQGDCVWGMVDGWRRPRPEWFLAKKIHSPIRIEEKPLEIPKPGEPIRIPVENLNWFANLNIYECRWWLDGCCSGTVRSDLPPSTKGAVEIALATAHDLSDSTLTLQWFDETGRLVDAYGLAFRPRELPEWKMGKAAAIVLEDGRYLSGAKAVYLKGDGCELAFDKTSGVLMWGLCNNEQLLLGGPTLHILNGENPTGDDPTGWKFTAESHKRGLIRWNGRFGGDYVGGYEIRMDRAGQIEMRYAFTYSGPDFYAREIGLEFDLPASFDHLWWERSSDHSVYPDDHIGRPVGNAAAHPPVEQCVPPRERPFSLDDHPWGCNDFRSAKRGMLRASLRNPRGEGIDVVSDGSQTLRCSLGVHSVSVKVLDYYGGSGGQKEWSVQGFHYGPGRHIRPGDILTGVVRIRLFA